MTDASLDAVNREPASRGQKRLGPIAEAKLMSLRNVCRGASSHAGTRHARTHALSSWRREDYLPQSVLGTRKLLFSLGAESKGQGCGQRSHSTGMCLGVAHQAVTAVETAGRWHRQHFSG